MISSQPVSAEKIKLQNATLKFKKEMHLSGAQEGVLCRGCCGGGGGGGGG